MAIVEKNTMRSTIPNVQAVRFNIIQGDFDTKESSVPTAMVVPSD